MKIMEYFINDKEGEGLMELFAVYVDEENASYKRKAGEAYLHYGEWVASVKTPLSLDDSYFTLVYQGESKDEAFLALWKNRYQFEL